jgi:2Fe-2S ferredoxin
MSNKVSVTINGQSTEVEVQELAEGQSPDPKKNPTLLEVACGSGVNLAHYCFGNAICSTCRVVVAEGSKSLTPKSTKEKVSLNYHLSFDDNTRLACQARVVGKEPIVVEAPSLFKMIAPPKLFGKKNKSA